MEWLRRHGLRDAKAGCVEMNCVADYLQTRGTWGVGGLLLHELSHAFHDHGCPDGYSCESIKEVCHLNRVISYSKTSFVLGVHSCHGSETV